MSCSIFTFFEHSLHVNVLTDAHTVYMFLQICGIVILSQLLLIENDKQYVKYNVFHIVKGSFFLYTKGSLTTS